MMAFFAAEGMVRIDSDSVVSHMKCQVVAVGQVDAETASVGMVFCILDRFVSNSIQLVANHRVQLSRVSNDGDRYCHSIGENTAFGGSPQCRSELILHRRRGAQRIECGAAFGNRLLKPTGDLS